MSTKKHGMFYWTDITIDQPEPLKEFYKKLFNWKDFGVPMKDGDESYEDYPGGGICHNRGQNAGMPAQWITYFYVDNVDESLEACIAMGGSLIKSSKKKDGTLNYVIVKDPQGNVFGMGNM